MGKIPRRAWLGGIGAAAAGSLAGCTMDFDFSIGDDEAAEEDFEAAVDQLLDNADVIDDLMTDEADYDQSDIEQLKTDIDDAKSLLDDAESLDDGDLAAAIESATAVADIQESLAEYYATTLDWEDAFDVGDAYIESDQYEQATDEFADAVDHADELLTLYEEIDTTQQSIDPDALGEPDLDYTGAVSAFLPQESQAEVEAIGTLTTGMKDFAAGNAELFDGFDAFEDEQYAVAASSFTAADTRFTDASDQFEELRDDQSLSADVRGPAIELTDTMDAFNSAVGYYIDAAEAAQDGDFTAAESLFADGNSELEETE